MTKRKEMEKKMEINCGNISAEKFPSEKHAHTSHSQLLSHQVNVNAEILYDNANEE